MLNDTVMPICDTEVAFLSTFSGLRWGLTSTREYSREPAKIQLLASTRRYPGNYPGSKIPLTEYSFTALVGVKNLKFWVT